MAKISKSATQPKIRNRVKYIAEQIALTTGETNTMVSQTIPNQAMSIQEMVNKFTISSEWPKTLPEQYDTPESLGLPDITRMDKVEIQALATETAEEIQKYQEKLLRLQEEEFVKVQEQNQILKQQNQQLQNDQNDPNR